MISIIFGIFGVTQSSVVCIRHSLMKNRLARLRWRHDGSWQINASAVTQTHEMFALGMNQDTESIRKILLRVLRSNCRQGKTLDLKTPNTTPYSCIRLQRQRNVRQPSLCYVTIHALNLYAVPYWWERIIRTFVEDSLTVLRLPPRFHSPRVQPTVDESRRPQRFLKSLGQLHSECKEPLFKSSSCFFHWRWRLPLS